MTILTKHFNMRYYFN